MTIAHGGSARLRLVLIAAVLAVSAPFAGSPFARDHARVDVTRLAAAVEREEDHVTALELAQWIRDRKDGLQVIDVRSAREFAEYHLPTAQHASLDSVVTMPFRTHDTIVLYSEGGAHAAQAWVLLRAEGYERVFFLRGGLYEWLDEVMNPTLAADASPARRAGFERVSALSRYFGGTPHTGAPYAGDAIPLAASAGDATRGRGAVSAAALVRTIRRRGC